MNAYYFRNGSNEDDSGRNQEIFVMASMEDQELSVRCSLVTDDTNINRTMNSIIQRKLIYGSNPLHWYIISSLNFISKFFSPR